MVTTDDTTALVERCAGLALNGLTREYPNKISHVLLSDQDVGSPRRLTPIFYGCFDWHSAVHGHWLLARCCRMYPAGRFLQRARSLLDESLTEENAELERRYMERSGRQSFERPYGLAWLLQLSAELHEWDHVEARAWGRSLEPLEAIAADRFLGWLPRLSHPVRTGEHSQTAFALGLVLDWARSRRHDELERVVSERARDYYLDDRGWRLAFEPGGEDFLSPSLAEADLLRRILDPRSLADWLEGFLPELSEDDAEDLLRPVQVTDSTDGKLAHLDGLNLSRAWMLEGILAGLPVDDERRPRLQRAARQHRDAGLASLAGDHYAGTHWLGTFAVYLMTRRGI